MTLHSAQLSLKENYKKIVVMGVVAFGLVAGLGVLKIGVDNRQKAAVSSGTATIALSPASTQLPPNQSASVDLMFNTQSDVVDGLQVTAYVSGTVPSDLSFTPATVTGLRPVIQTLSAPDPTVSTKKLVLLLLTSDPTQPFTTSSSSVKVGTFHFTAPSSGTMSITFDQQNTLTTNNNTAADVLKIPAAGTYTFVQAGPAGKLSLSEVTPANPQVVNRSFTANILVDVGTSQISGVDARLKYDPTVLRVVKVTKATGTPFAAFQDLSFDSVAGTISVSANVGVAANPTPLTGNNLELAQITFVPLKAAASTSVTFNYTAGNRNDSNISTFVQSGQDPQDILSSVGNYSTAVTGIAVTPTPSPTPSASPVASPTPTATPVTNPTPTPSTQPIPTPSASPTPTPSPSGSPFSSLRLRLAFQGRNRTGVNQALAYTLYRQLIGSNSYSTDSERTDTNGETVLNITPSDYIFLVKVPGYLAKKFGNTASPLQIVPTTTLLDFSNYSLLGGDFNGDGVVNEVDYTLFFLNKFKSNDPLVDLDGSGEVNNLDFALMRSNWGLTADQLP